MEVSPYTFCRFLSSKNGVYKNRCLGLSVKKNVQIVKQRDSSIELETKDASQFKWTLNLIFTHLNLSVFKSVHTYY